MDRDGTLSAEPRNPPSHALMHSPNGHSMRASSTVGRTHPTWPACGRQERVAAVGGLTRARPTARPVTSGHPSFISLHLTLANPRMHPGRYLLTNSFDDADAGVPPARYGNQSSISWFASSTLPEACTRLWIGRFSALAAAAESELKRPRIVAGSAAAGTVLPHSTRTRLTAS